MNDLHSVIKSAVPRLLPYEIEALAVALEKPEASILEELRTWLTEPWGTDKEFSETAMYNRSFDYDDIKALASRLTVASRKGGTQ